MPQVGDMQNGSLKDFLSNNVITQVSEHNIIDLYTVCAGEEDSKVTWPFIHQVKLQGTKRGTVYIRGLFNVAVPPLDQTFSHSHFRLPLVHTY